MVAAYMFYSTEEALSCNSSGEALRLVPAASRLVPPARDTHTHTHTHSHTHKHLEGGDRHANELVECFF